MSVEIKDNILEDEAFVKEMDKRTKELESGIVEAYKWDEVKQITRKSLSEMKQK